ncbi:hypothetical protein CANARDRAFT_27380 [[Candida] arabinofermentans NRRL YB-2248]|uniref:Uncharacterized protein n=1 Tax=[Candida] arabinofermentans NRRL YB-2248 TaxID=983967 RepID=A0A1E4T5N3_9ASCO|nr:hypothetical protein CANARDRAFT_27380 [[Candida] arabinofermentans NRRL YB-2248]
MIWQQSTSLPTSFLSTQYLIGNSSLTNYQLHQVNKFIGLLIYIVESQRILAHQQEDNALPALSHSSISQYHHKYNSRYGYWDSPITS